MKYIDYLFYSYYCYFERRNKCHPKICWGDSRFYALMVIYISIAVPLGACYGLISIFITPLPSLPERHSLPAKLIGTVLGIFTIGPLIYRYYYDKKICRNNFKLFRDRWGEDPRVHTKGKIAVRIYTFITIFLPLLGPIILYFIYK